MSEFLFTTRDGAVIRGLDEGAGPPLLCVSGLGGTASFWDPCAAELMRDWRLVRLDQRGIGASSRGQAPCTVEQLADDCLALLDARRIEACVVAGHSTGGCIAQAMAHAAPHRVRAMALSGSWAKPDRYLHELFTMRLSLLGDSPRAYASSSAFLSYEPAWLDAHWDAYERLVATAPTDPTAQAVVRERMHALLRFDQSARLSALTCPTLVVGARDDLIVPPHLQASLAQFLPGARLVLLERGGHFFPVTRSAEFLAVLRGWLTGVVPGAAPAR